MLSEHAFLRQRLALVEHGLASPDKEFVYVGKGRARYRTEPSSKRDVTREREARLLRKLLTRTREGQVLTTLKAWRRQLGEFLTEHRQRYKEMQEAYDAWWRLPPYQRERVPQPPRPPSPRHIDRDGVPWIVDDRFLVLLDDLIERLQKWIEEA
ncbi:MAG: hypothetical protein H8D78_08315 [Chloroflexi bacterium]|nr:hypothetical protein [Chloroflexota bacterium]